MLAGFVLIAVVVPVRCMPSGEMGYQCATLYGRNGRRRKVEAKWFVKKKKRKVKRSKPCDSCRPGAEAQRHLD